MYNLEEKSFILAHSFRDFSPWYAGSQGGNMRAGATGAEGCSLHGREWGKPERKRGEDNTYPTNLPPVTCFL